MHIQLLPGVGAEITGLDLRDLSDADFAAIRQAYVEQGVIFFRDQHISEAEHIAFARRWAPINVNRFLSAHPLYPEIAVLVKEPGDTENIGGAWHTDHSYDLVPAMGSILVARQLPPAGGNTLFASMYAAYEALPRAMQERLETLRAVHSARHIFGKDAAYGKERSGRVSNSDAADALVDSVHPVVITHPLSGKKALFVNLAYTIRIEGLSDAESQSLLNDLIVHCMQPEFSYEFEWRPGSIAFWDNRATWHYAKNDYHGHRREMHRITLEGQPIGGTPLVQ
ncbi:MAG: TauD/TfdA family dioxygenase [Hyphomonadaceae bacterium]|nr:TauD/TfdA family dioxygenase [Hyphomonadaceae bacterium]